MTRSAHPEGGFVEVNGTQLYYETLGDGPPLVLIHGGYMDRRMWDDQFPLFAERYRVIRYDVRGFGKSALPQVPYSDRQDLLALLQHLGVTRTYLLGLSLGGRIATDFILEHPDLVEALVLVGSPVGGLPRRPPPTNEAGEPQLSPSEAAYQKAKEERNIPALVDALMSDPTLVPSPDYPAARQRVRDNLSEYSFVWVLNAAPRQELDPPAYGRLSEIRVPTLILLGSDDDPELFQHADKLARDIAGARRVTIAQTHHMPNMEKPEEFNAIVLDFLGGL
jgi:pimeloyl-ACP methyl ester carboxylesterase